MSKKNILFGMLIFLMIGIAIANSSVKADTPITLDIAYDLDEQYVSVWFTHGVTDPSYHYVSLVTIQVNGILVRTVTYTSQPTHNLFNIIYPGIVAVEHDDIRVNATCIFGGTISEHAEAGWRYTRWKKGFTAALEPTVIFTLLVAVLLLVVPYLGRKKAEIIITKNKPVIRLLILIGILVIIELLFILVINPSRPSSGLPPAFPSIPFPF
ncbi:MAG: hypothetical protein ACFE85_17400 [Candidatus Hodarchaeota archaeon]